MKKKTWKNGGGPEASVFLASAKGPSKLPCSLALNKHRKREKRSDANTHTLLYTKRTANAFSLSFFLFSRFVSLRVDVLAILDSLVMPR